MPKLGVLTFHSCINYGSFWQAYCLVHGLRLFGADALILDHHSTRVNRAEWRCALQPRRPFRTCRDDLPLYVAKARKFLGALECLPLSPPFSLDDPSGAEACDTIIVGSDEVWNLRHPWYGGCPLFYGDGLAAKTVISYAATFGSHPAETGIDSVWVRRLEKFDAVSVRDQNSRSILEHCVGREAAIVLDPCLLFSDVIVQAEEIRTASPFVAVYGHSFPRWFQRQIVAWARTRAYRLISIGYRNDWADEQWIEAGPFEFAGCTAHASAIVTNFFHGCVFALLNAKPFACVLSDYRHNKIRDLTALLGVQARVVSSSTSPAQYDAILDMAPGPAVSKCLAELHQQSWSYLSNAVQ